MVIKVMLELSIQLSRDRRLIVILFFMSAWVIYLGDADDTKRGYLVYMLSSGSVRVRADCIKLDVSEEEGEITGKVQLGELEALIVPGIKENLVSISDLTSRGSTLELSNSGGVISNPYRQEISKGK